jgi:hypothetical protein
MPQRHQLGAFFYYNLFLFYRKLNIGISIVYMKNLLPI